MEQKSEGLKWFNLNIKPYLDSKYELKFVNEQGGDLGDLSGVQFDSEKQGGYIYFWSLGFVGYQLFDYVNEIELVEDTTTEVGSRSYNEILSKLLLKLKK